MPIATASSAYVLEDRASPVLKSIREEAGRATVALRSTATAADKIGAPAQMQRLTRFETKLRSIATTAETMSGRVQRTVGHMEGSIRRDTLKAEARLTSLEGRLDTLGHKRATPSVDLDGYAIVRAQIESLDRALASLARRNASPSVSMAPTAIGGGVARAATGGGRSGVFAGSGGIGAFTSRPALIGGAVTLGLPVLGAIPPVAASLTGAALGGGALGLAGGGALAAGAGGIVSIVKPMSASIKELRKDQQAYTAAVRQYGATSTQAAAAQQKLDQAVAKAPAGARNFTRELDLLTARWRHVTAPGQTDLLGLGAGVARRTRSAAPFLGAQANISAGAVREQGLNLAGWATSPAGLIIVRDLTHAFATNLDEAERTLEHVLGTAGNLARASLPFFHEGMVFLDHWTAGWEHSTRDIGQTRQQIGGYVQDLKAVGRLGGAGFDLIRDLVMPGRHQGTSLVGDLTLQLREWDDWAKRNPDRIQRFYRDSIAGTKELAKLLGEIGSELHSVAEILLPVVSRFAQLGQIAGGTGLLLPTLLRVGVGRAMGGGGRTAGGGGGVAIGGGGAGAAIGGGDLALAGAAAGGASYLAMRNRAGALAVPEAFGQRYGTVAGARYGAPTSALGARASALGRLRGPAGAVGRFAAPIALVSGAISAATTPGTLEERLQAAASGATFGLIPGPVTRAQAREQGQARAVGDVQRLALPQTPADYARQIASLERQRRGALARSRTTRTGALGGVGFLGAFDPGRGGDAGPTATEARRNAAAADKYAEAIRNLRAEQRSYRAENERRRGVASELHGDQLAQSFQTGFRTLSRREGPASALRETLGGAVDRMRKMRPEGAKVLSESMLTWAHTIARGNPRMQAVVQDMTDQIESRFSRLGKHVEVVNNRILTGSRTEWRQIGQALTDPAEQARQKVTRAFTDIQREAIGSLRAMGYSTAEARALVKARETGGQALGNVTAGISATHGDTAASRARRGASGDGTGDGPGTRGPARRTAGGSSPSLMGANAGLSLYADEGTRFGMHVSSGLRRGAITSSGNVSLHASGDAIDETGSKTGMLSYARFMASHHGRDLDELIHTPLGFGIKNGQRVPLSFWGQTINTQHEDHVHVGDRTPGGAAGGISTVGGARFVMGPGGTMLRLRRRRSGMRGAPGALADRAIQSYATGLEDRVNAGLGGGGGGIPGSAAGGGSGSAAALRVRFGLPPIFDAIRGAESGGDPNAHNASGAGGWYQLMMPLHEAMIRRLARQLHRPASVFDPVVNTAGAAELYHESGLSPWTASRGVWGRSLGAGRGDGIGWYGRGGSGTARRPTLIGIGDHPRGEDFAVRPTRIGPPVSRAGRGQAAGLGTVTIQHMTVHWARDGDLTAAVKAELHRAMADLATELDDGVHADEDALIR